MTKAIQTISIDALETITGGVAAAPGVTHWPHGMGGLPTIGRPQAPTNPMPGLPPCVPSPTRPTNPSHPGFPWSNVQPTSSKDLEL